MRLLCSALLSKRIQTLVVGSLVGVLVCLSAHGQNTQARIWQIDKQIFDCKVKIQALESQEEAALDELRRGLFCSVCGRSKSEIERTGEGFEAHLKRVQGHAVATQEMLDNKRAFYEDQIAALRRQIAQLEGMKQQLADAAQQQAELERQRAAEQWRQQQLAVQQERQRQLQAQLDKARQERERIVEKAQAKVEANQRATEVIKDGIQQIGNAFREQMEKDRFEREQRSYDRQIADLEEQIKAVPDAQAAETPTDRPANTGYYNGGSELPAPIQLREPPGEEALARGNSGSPSLPANGDATDQQLALMRERSSGQSVFQATPAAVTPPFEPPQRLGDLSAGYEDYHRQTVQQLDQSEKFYQQHPGYTGPAPGSQAVTSLLEPADDSSSAPPSGGSSSDLLRRARDLNRDEVKPRVSAVMDRLFDQTTTYEGIDPVAAITDEAKDEGKQGLSDRVLEVLKRKPFFSGGRCWNDLSEEDRQWWEIKWDMAKYIWYFARRDAKEAANAVGGINQISDDNLKKLTEATGGDPDN